jgi:hypothetical protein
MLERQFKTKINKTVFSWTEQRRMRTGEIQNE